MPMNTQTSRSEAEYRPRCFRCRRPCSSCYCPLIAPFESQPRFVILTQPREAKHRFGTGRMTHLCLKNSPLVEGVDFSRDERVGHEIVNLRSIPVLLFPRADSLNLSRMTSLERATLTPRDRRLVVFVLDGTWKSVRKMIRLSENLACLPAISFDPPTPSNYRIRRQPKPYCYSTIEAVHQVIELLTPQQPDETRDAAPQDNLLAVFRSVIKQQLTFTP
jgi:tRNA-uridine aminocarboxypropyltransferase